MDYCIVLTPNKSYKNTNELIQNQFLNLRFLNNFSRDKITFKSKIQFVDNFDSDVTLKSLP